MNTIKHECENCDNTFKIVYDEEVCNADPIHCPFCAEYIIDNPSEESDDSMDD
jgi:hypothetical protein